MKVFTLLPIFLFLLVNAFSQEHLLIKERRGEYIVNPKLQPLIEVCNLEVGAEYTLSLNFDRRQIPFQVKLKNYRKGQNTFVAKSSCKIFELETTDILKAGDYVFFNIQQKKEVNTTKQMTFNVIPSTNPTSIINDIFQNNDCFEIISPSISYSGNIGTYVNGDALGSSDGIIMSTGDVEYAEGPNNQSGNGPTIAGREVDSDLIQLSGGFDTYDVTIIEFDFIPTGGFLFFQYTFTSEEYCDFVGEDFNDAFGFFLSGPGINGPYSNNSENLALVNGTDPVTVNSINWRTNNNQYISNVPVTQFQDNNRCRIGEIFSAPIARQEFQFDGLTTVLTATAEVLPCEVYHLKLAIADVSDDGYDSAVMLKAGSFFAGGDALIGATANGSVDNLVVYENCGDQELIVKIDRGPESNIEEPMLFGLEVSGSATAIADYSFINTFYEIPAFEEFFEIPVSIVSDDITEGTETIKIELTTACNCDEPPIVIEIEIRETEELEVNLNAAPVCEGEKVMISSTVSGGAPAYRYRWSNGFTGTFIEVDPADGGMYTLRVDDECGNRKFDTIQLEIITTPLATLSGGGTLCDTTQVENLTIDLEGEGPFEIVIQNPLGDLDTLFTSESSISIPSSAIGSYELISVQAECPGNVVGLVQIEINDLEINLQGENPLCNNEGDGSASLSITGGQMPYTILWENGSGDLLLSNIEAGNYGVTVIDDIGCQQSSIVELQNPSVLNVQTIPSGISTCQDPMAGSINIEVTGGVSPYTYNWNTNEETSRIENLAAGSYSVTVTDVNGCSFTIEEEIMGDVSLPMAMAQPLGTFNCSTSSVLISTLGSSTGSEYELTLLNASGQNIVIANPAEIEVTSAGFYTLVILNTTNGCEARNIVEIKEDTETPFADFETPSVLNCDNPFSTLTLVNISANTNIVWTSLDDNSIIDTSPFAVRVSTAGDYLATLFNEENGCTSEIMFTVLENRDVPIINLMEPPFLNCRETSFTYSGEVLNSTSLLSYEWYFDNTLLSDNEEVEIDQEGTYTFLVSNLDSGCTSEKELVIFNNFVEPDFTIEGPLEFNCIDVSLSLIANVISSSTMGYTYSWTSENGIILSGELDEALSIGSAGVYTLTVVDLSNGCSSESEVIVSANQDLPDFEINNPEPLNCINQSAILSLETTVSSLDVNVVWMYNGQVILGENDLTINASLPGEYTASLSDNLTGCTQLIFVEVLEDLEFPFADAGADRDLGCLNSGLTIDSRGSLGADFVYSWQTSDGLIIAGGNTLTPTFGTIGTYDLTVTNILNGCSSTSSTSLIANGVFPTLEVPIPQPINCNNMQSSINALVDNMDVIYSFVWTGPDGFVDVENLSIETSQPGIYMLTVTSLSNGCQSSVSVEVVQDLSPPSILLLEPEMLTCVASTVTILAENTNEAANLSYDWSTSNGEISSASNAQQLQVSMPGIYMVEVVNEDTGCSVIKEIEVIENKTPPTFSLNANNIIDCNNPIATISIVIEGNAEQIVQDWQIPLSGNIELVELSENSVSINEEGIYSLLLTNLENGCTAVESVEIQADIELPIVQAAIPEVLNCENPSVELTLENTDNMNLSYAWFDANQNAFGPDANSITVEDSQTYSVLVTNLDNGCEIIVPIQVNENLTSPEATIVGAAELTCGVSNLMLQSASIDSDNIYSWFDENGTLISNTFEVQVDQRGIYTLSVTHALSQCTSEDQIEVFESVGVPNIDFTAPSILDCRNTETSISLFNIDAEIEITFSTINGNIVSSLDQNLVVDLPGVYTIHALNPTTGCERNIEVTIVQDTEAPLVDAGPGFELNCLDPIYQLQGTSNLDQNISIIWSTSDSNNMVNDSNELDPTVNMPGIYELTVINERNGCEASDIVEVAINENIPLGLFLDIIDPLCAGDLGQLDIFGVDGGFGPYLYSIDNGANYEEFSFFENLAPNEYIVKVQDQNGCEFDQLIIIPETPEVFADLPPELELSLGDNAQLLTTTNISNDQIESIVWSPSTFLSCDDCLNPQITGVQDQSYTITITNVNGCVATASIQLRVDRDTKVYIPNAFSPTNTDGTNDVFMIFAKEGAVENINTFQIFDRWGTQVYTDRDFMPNDRAHGWDGIYKEERLNPGVFVYWTEILFIDGTTILYKGDLTLLN